MSRCRRRILFVYRTLATFVQVDRDALAQQHEVSELRCPDWKCIHPVDLWRRVAAIDLVFGWWASWHTVLPMLFARLQGKPSVLVIGGYDIAKIPEIGYGSQRGGLRRWISRLAMHSAGALVTNSYYSQREAEKNIGIDAQRIRVVYHGVPDFYEGRFPDWPRERVALTVGSVCFSNLTRKGHELFVLTARLVPDVTFVVAGEWLDGAIDYLRRIAPPNVEFTGRLDETSLARLYARSAVYVQMSKHEGFGVSVAEAMTAGCFPIVSSAGALPELVGEVGRTIDTFDSRLWAKAISESMAVEVETRRMIRNRTLTRFPIEARQNALLELVENL